MTIQIDLTTSLPSTIYTNDQLKEVAIKHVVLEGLYLEFGVYKGDSIKKLSNLTNNTFYGFDSFEGLPEKWRDGSPAGTFKCSPPHHLEEEANIKLVVGLFNETLEPFLETHKENVAFVHIDCDLYSSTKYIFDTLESRIKPGTVILFDELYHYPEWELHEYKAFVEFLDRTGYKASPIGCDGAERAAFVIGD
ncbi:Macrocin-O-methyltransferase [uncultured Caudovirales phage]|uniref:Macrocin-O-methyltransferase n=1 Tax=uncultured Caudovirales phage TaxID=2100421 RepID=A0A6J7WXJ9_9CAUD|nr:Macrocin-O-methyltransferase [uncultured Caudovirales phage]